MKYEERREKVKKDDLCGFREHQKFDFFNSNHNFLRRLNEVQSVKSIHYTGLQKTTRDILYLTDLYVIYI